jgi:hypothetical protein
MPSAHRSQGPSAPSDRIDSRAVRAFAMESSKIVRPLIASSTVFNYARHEVWTPMLASRDEKRNE